MQEQDGIWGTVSDLREWGTVKHTPWWCRLGGPKGRFSASNAICFFSPVGGSKRLPSPPELASSGFGWSSWVSMGFGFSLLASFLDCGLGELGRVFAVALFPQCFWCRHTSPGHPAFFLALGLKEQRYPRRNKHYSHGFSGVISIKEGKAGVSWSSSRHTQGIAICRRTCCLSDRSRNEGNCSIMYAEWKVLRHGVYETFDHASITETAMEQSHFILRWMHGKQSATH